jgi:hypothetical protein
MDFHFRSSFSFSDFNIDYRHIIFAGLRQN